MQMHRTTQGTTSPTMTSKKKCNRLYITAEMLEGQADPHGGFSLTQGIDRGSLRPRELPTRRHHHLTPGGRSGDRPLLCRP